MLGVCETSINRTENYGFGDYVYPIDGTWLDGTLPNLYKYGSEEFGRCIGKVYIGDGKHIGYVFVKRDKYEDTGETFLRETWVSLGEYVPACEAHLKH